MSYAPSTGIPRDARARPTGETLALADGTVVWLSIGQDDASHEVLGDATAITATAEDGREVARVSYARVYGPRALITITIDDAFWHRGLPEVLLASLCMQAACVGISTFLARAHAADVRLLAMLREQFAARIVRDGAFAEVEFSTVFPVQSGWSTEPGAAFPTDAGRHAQS